MPILHKIVKWSLLLSEYIQPKCDQNGRTISKVSKCLSILKDCFKSHYIEEKYQRHYEAHTLQTSGDIWSLIMDVSGEKNFT